MPPERPAVARDDSIEESKRLELKEAASHGRPMTDDDLHWLSVNRVGRVRPKLNAAELVSRMRDEEWR